MLLQHWMQLRNRPFRKVPLNILEGLGADATAERMFLKRPHNFFWIMLLQQWTQLRNRHFQKVPPNILEGLEVDATAEKEAFPKGPSKYSRRVRK